MNKTRKILSALGIISIATLLAGVGYATLLQTTGTLNTTANISQAVTLDDHNWNDPVNETINGTGGCIYFSTIHVLENHGFDGVWLNMTENGIPDLNGIQITVFYRQHHFEKAFIDEPLTADVLTLHWIPLHYPFYLPGHACWDVCWMYHFNSLIVPQQYSISSVFIPATI